MAEAGRVDMRAGDHQALARRHVEHALARHDRLVGVEIVAERRLGMRNLDRREMDDVAPGDERLAAAIDAPYRVARRMAGRENGSAARKFFAIAHPADALAIGRQIDLGALVHALRILAFARL